MTSAANNPTDAAGGPLSGPPVAPENAHILLCDDDPEIRKLLTALLRDNGFRVTPIADGRDVERQVSTAVADLLILDLMLPGIDGLSICRNLRTYSTIPILMLTAKGTETDRIVGLEMGADDYIGKPFSPHELLARVKALLRRARMGAHEITRPSGRAFYFEGWQLDTLRRELRNPQSVIIDLSAGEYDLLLTFLEAPNRVLDRDYLIEVTRKKTLEGFDRSIDVQVSRLRRKLEHGEGDDTLIKTVRGAGYMLAAEVRRT
jgi:two-component system OmpR family response regulator